ncbi:hypothetical protein ACVW0Y_000301 [Pseudomonas sp. TE3786]
MNVRPISTALLLSLFTSLPALADGGTLSFQGRIVESACSVTASAQTSGQAISPGVNLLVSPANDACSRYSPAFTAQYLPLSASETDLANRVITITYN